MKKVTIYIDESGTLPDPNDKLVVVAAVGTPSPERIDIILKQAKKKTSFTPQAIKQKNYFLRQSRSKTFHFTFLS